MTCSLHRRRSVQVAAAVTLLGALAATVWSQRATVTGAIEQIGRISAVGIVLLSVLTVYERWSRADVVHRLLGRPVGRGRAWVVHDVGTAVSKGVPLGGALGTAVRWTIARRSGVAPTRFASTLIAYGVATTFTSWLLPFAALAVDMVGRPLAWLDVAILAGIAVVVTASLVFWLVVLRSDRLEAWLTHRLEAVWTRLAARLPSVGAIEPASGVATVRRELLGIARRPLPLLGRTVCSQAGGAVILFVALRSLGVGDELGTTEFFRVFFLTHLLGTFAPTPGGVGVVEAGMTGALVAAGVPTTTALAGVLVWRLLTYVLPIVLGAALYVVWKVRGPAGDAPDASLVGPAGSGAVSAGSGADLDGSASDAADERVGRAPAGPAPSISGPTFSGPSGRTAPPPTPAQVPSVEVPEFVARRTVPRIVPTGDAPAPAASSSSLDDDVASVHLDDLLLELDEHDAVVR